MYANAYVAEGQWDEFAQVRNEKNHTFCVGERSHPQVEEIY
jgi:hypothetical protein